jgi:hypothetical protein
MRWDQVPVASYYTCQADNLSGNKGCYKVKKIIEQAIQQTN